MQSSLLFGLAALLTLAYATPVPDAAVTLARRTPVPATAEVDFIGAAGAQYSLNVPLDGSVTYINNPLSISTISSTIDILALCTLVTVDYTPALVASSPGSYTWAVGPPQTIISITCTGYNPPPPTTITIDFDGANPDQGVYYTLSIPLDGTVVPTNNVLSISTIVTHFPDVVAKCSFSYIDSTAALTSISANTWAVGPPQTINSVSCSA